MSNLKRFVLAMLICFAFFSVSSFDTRLSQAAPRVSRPAAPQWAPGRLVGSVKNADTGAPVGEGTITVVGKRTVHVDHLGKYEVTGLPGGTFEVIFKSASFKEVHKHATIFRDHAAVLEFEVTAVKSKSKNK